MLPTLRTFSGLTLVLIGFCLVCACQSRPGSEPRSGRNEDARLETSDTPPDSAARSNGSVVRPLFTETTEKAGLGGFRHYTGAAGNKWEPETMGSGVAFLDYDGDRWLDLLIVGGGYWDDTAPEGYRALWLYRNQGDGTFELVTEQAGLADVRAYGFGVSAADYDRDGDPDLLLTTLTRNRLFENRGGTFREVRDDGLPETRQWSSSALFFDADRDGRPDVLVGGYVDWSRKEDVRCALEGTYPSYCTPGVYDGVPTRYYQNVGNGQFTERSRAVGIRPNPGKTLGIAATDFDDDGWTDLVLANDMVRNLLFHNTGDGTFSEIGLLSGIAFDPNGSARAGMGVATGVVDSTGEPSFFIGNFAEETFGVFQHRGDRIFRDRSRSSGLGDPTFPSLTFGLLLLDFDLDGDLDLFAVNGHVQSQVVHTGGAYRQKPQLFRNTGDGRFRPVDPDAFPYPRDSLVGRGAAYGDYDRDGDLDLVLTENGGGVHLWRNELSDRESVRIHLRGTESTTSGLGTKLVGWTSGRRMIRRVATGSSYLSQSELTVTFGLDDRTRLDSLRVRWPRGRTVRFTSIEGGREYLLVEGTQELQARHPRQAGKPRTYSSNR